jgi:thiopurine S-methyltransferase
MTTGVNAGWRQCWRDRHADFHQESVNRLLARFWSDLDLAPGSRVFVPLCGKSLDMLWLARQGHDVIGVELSPIAVRSFFRENGLKPVRRQVGKFVLWQSGKLGILCGDYFSLTAADLGQVDAVYDRAALTALAEDSRSRYVAHLRTVVPGACMVLLLTVEDAEAGESLHHSHAIAGEVTALYAEAFDFDLIHVESVYETDRQSADQPPQRSEHKAYRLRAKFANPEMQPAEK